MNRARFASSFLCAAVLASGASGVRMLAQLPANATVYASGLEGPRGLAFGPDGTLYVAEAGLGGKTSTVGTCVQVIPPIGPYTGGLTARISKVDTKGNVTTLTSGLPSSVGAMGAVLGVADVAFLYGDLYAVLAGGGCSHGNTAFPNKVIKVNTKTGSWTNVANMSQALLNFPAKFTSPDDYEPDGTWYGMISYQGSLYTVEPNHGQVFSVTPWGQVQQVIDISASQGHIVPTSLVFTEGVLYVGNLNLFPIDPQWAKVQTIANNVYVPNPLPGFGNSVWRLWTVEHRELEGRVYDDCEYEDRTGWAAVCAGALGFCGARSDAGEGQGRAGEALGRPSGCGDGPVPCRRA